MSGLRLGPAPGDLRVALGKVGLTRRDELSSDGATGRVFTGLRCRRGCCGGGEGRVVLWLNRRVADGDDALPLLIATTLPGERRCNY